MCVIYTDDRQLTEKFSLKSLTVSKYKTLVNRLIIQSPKW